MTAEVFLRLGPLDLGMRHDPIAAQPPEIFDRSPTLVRVPMAQVPAFIPAYEAALMIEDLITAALLFGLCRRLRARALLVLAAGYLFDALMIVPHALTFPGLFSPTGLLGAGEQTTAWLYMIWHGGFPLFVLGYALLKDKDGGHEIRGSAGTATVWAVIAVLSAMAAAVFVVTELHQILPTLIMEQGYTPALFGVALTVWLLNLAALIVLWLRRPHSVLAVARPSIPHTAHGVRPQTARLLR